MILSSQGEPYQNIGRKHTEIFHEIALEGNLESNINYKHIGKIGLTTTTTVELYIKLNIDKHR